MRERRRRETGASRSAENSHGTLNRTVADQSETGMTGQGTLFGQVGEQRMVLSVSDLTRLIKGTLEENFVSVWVEGEISNFATPRSGHLYFTLKDESAQIRGVVFRGVASRLTFILKDGMAVLLHGRVTVYEPRGEYQIVADRVEPAGVGALQVAFQQLKEKLAKEGLFEESRKIPIPPHPRRVGVVTSPSGAAIHDIITVLSRRRALVDLQLMPVRVQGEGAAEEIAAAIADFNRIGGVDVLIVGRGGGSLEDLWAFNEEVVARAVAASRIPVISAVGHEVDFTICDFVADCRAATPSAAAEMVARSGLELAERIAGARERLALAVKGILERSRDRFRVSLRSLRDPAVVIGLHQIRLDDLWARLEASMMRGVGERRRTLMEREKSLGILSPRSIAARRREQLDLLRERLRRGVEIGNASRRERLLRLDAALRSASPVRVLELRRQRCQGVLERLERGMERYLGFRREALARAETLLGGVSPRGELQQGRERCRRLVERLQTAVTRDVTLRRKRLAQLCASLDALSPLAVLARGYALARRADGSIVSDASILTVGELLRLRFGKGGALCRVDRVEPGS